MRTKLEDTKSGRLIALEGDTDVISTQLRLLPPSQKIMILPDFLDKQSSANHNGVFDARAYVRHVQRDLFQRTETARSFIQSSTPRNPRLVFAIHGSIGARAECITKISQNLTNGNVGEAEKIFNDIVQDGVAGLMKMDDAVEEVPFPGNYGFDRVLGNTSVNSIQRERSLGCEAVLSIQKREDTVKASHEISTEAHKGQIVRTVLTVPSRSKATLLDKRMAFRDTHSAPYLPDRAQDTDTDNEMRYDANDATAGEDSIMSAPITAPVITGEACLVGIQPSPVAKIVRRAQSSDGISLINPRYSQPTLMPRALKQTASQDHLSERSQSAVVMQTERNNEADRFTAIPRTTFLKASETIVRGSPTLTKSTRSSNSSSASREMPNRAVYVDRGTGAEEAIVTDSKIMPFVPVFELVEDVVIQFTDDSPNDIFESVVKSYKNGSYPILPMAAETSASAYPSSLVDIDEGYNPMFGARSVASPRLMEDLDIRPISCLTTVSFEAAYDRQQEYDPYAAESNSCDIQRHRPPNSHPRISLDIESASTPTQVKPLREAETPPLLENENSKKEISTKFVKLTPVNPGNAISVQNSFRRLLEVFFPPHEKYSQFYYQVAPEVERMWKPVLRNDENFGKENEIETVDQIIAFGSEDGVERNFFFHLSGQIERFGSRRDGLNRSGKLDIRYLISNVMQSHCSVQPTDQAIDSLANPDILAALIVPQIEAFLATNTSTRLLVLHYTPTDLHTIFALRKLLGSDLFKVAAILDSLASDPPSMSRPGTYVCSRPRTPISSRSLSCQNITSGQPSTIKNRHMPATALIDKNSFQLQPSIEEPISSLAEADFFLPSTATNSEIANFLARVRKCLVNKSAFYAMEPEPKSVIIERLPIPLPASPTRIRDRDSGYPASEFSGLACGAAPSISPDTTRGNGKVTGYAASTVTSKHRYTASIASVETKATQIDKKGDKDWENFDVGEEDSDDDEFDRMIMGREMQKITPEVKQVEQKRNKKKALKWLGLA
ncbi:hypothetical protein QTJ16_006213 [Diplocarpon rosae]|uniref:Gastric mucin-like protein n=1 Tax=Diplocarpon rosae TaxID=946125 RepID=A0AAD9STB5_9HELO|nr:hypothetical protein QTJ16_006213 [Diplocarpon rosae]PBP23937.1 hypothetical protein BUE80_DR005084 [Diplocarpon rosae]